MDTPFLTSFPPPVSNFDAIIPMFTLPSGHLLFSFVLSQDRSKWLFFIHAIALRPSIATIRILTLRKLHSFAFTAISMESFSKTWNTHLLADSLNSKPPNILDLEMIV
jgi:hypothetical protein